MTLCTGAGAQILPTPEYGGDLASRSTLTGDWGGSRGALAAKGLHFSADSVLSYQNTFSGGFDTGDDLIGSTSLIFQLDTGKAKLWPGALVTMRAEGRYGDGIQGSTGALIPPNTDALFPASPGQEGENALAISELSITQFLSPKIGVVVGLLDTTAGDANHFAGSSRSNDHFMNTAFVVSPVDFRTTPQVTLGGGLVFLPAKTIQASVMLLDSTESAGEDPFDEDSTGGLTLAGELSISHTLGGRAGKQSFGLLYGFDRDYTTVGLDRGTFLRSLLGAAPVQTEDSSWAFYYTAHQYVQDWGDGRGWGLFGRFGLSDGDVNPVEWNMALGIGGKGVFKSRPNDTFGIGYYRVAIVEGAVTRLLDLDDEQGFEAYYNMALTPWLRLTADLQYVDTAFGQPGAPLLAGLGPGGLLPVATRLAAVPSSDSAWIFGLRARVEF